MNLGNFLIVLTTAACLTCTFSYFMVLRGKAKFAELGRLSYKYFTALVLMACALLFYYFISGDYSYKYVYDYSSSDLPLFYLISAFWAGQQGTYLLWLALLAFFGFYLIYRGREYTNHAMFVYGLINFFFCVMLLILSPFEKLPVAQPEGAGLNPLLIDPWMVIHPPVIFIGYAAAAVPYAIALAALIKNDYKNWLTIVFVPVTVVAVTLAAGNIMGGFWAYKTLGWGGYWAWDPVENSSFIPWMISLALVHGLLIERRSGSLPKTNLFMAILIFLLVVYGTFLTRSGVLADFSVHSFVDLGVNNLLISFMSGSILLALFYFVIRFKRVKGPAVNLSMTSKQFALLFSVWVLILIALLVLSGTSWPLITSVFGEAGAVDTTVYTKITFPLAILMGIFLGLAPAMAWNGGNLKDLLKKSIISIVVALVISLVCYFRGVKEFTNLLYIFTVSVAVISNLIALIKLLPGKIKSAGAQLSHFGFALMLLGILGSSAYALGEKIVINRNETGSVFNLEIEYQGLTSHLENPQNEILLKVSDSGEIYEARPKLYWSERSQGLMKKPYISRHLLYDIYFAPEQIQDLSAQNGIILEQSHAIPLGSYSFAFKGFATDAHAEGGEMKFGAEIEVTDTLGQMGIITPAIIYRPAGGMEYIDVPLREGLENHRVRLEQIYADQGAVRISVEGLTDKNPEDRLILEVSKKPTMNILWAGTILLVLGGLLSFGNRWEKQKNIA
ncbi:MAG: cytochrome c biogenesis protein CcsA [candidate division Zixibacteria bacterium]